MMDRRDILKRFGIGAIIVPVIGGAAVTSSAVELIEVPKVRPVELFKEIPKPIALSEVDKATINLKFKDGTARSIMVADWFSGTGRLLLSHRLEVFIQFSSGDSSPAATVGEIYGRANLL